MNDTEEAIATAWQVFAVRLVFWLMMIGLYVFTAPEELVL